MELAGDLHAFDWTFDGTLCEVCLYAGLATIAGLEFLFELLDLSGSCLEPVFNGDAMTLESGGDTVGRGREAVVEWGSVNVLVACPTLLMEAVQDVVEGVQQTSC